MELRNRRVVVTGASSGIGLELVLRLLAAGCTVVAAARGVEKINTVDSRLFVKKCDVSKKEELDSLFTFAQQKMGDIDIFIANAGFAYYEKLETPDWVHITEIFATNVTALIYCAEKMKELRGEKAYGFICIASGMSFLSLPGYSLYSATKAAIRGFADAYRFELGDGQCFQVVYPVATRTNFFANAGSTAMPWPVQTTATVANAIIEGIKKGKKSIYPSKLYRLSTFLNRFFPFVNLLYLRRENEKFRRFLQEAE